MGIYLDHNATTPLREEVVEALRPFLGEAFGNPSSLHGYGRRVREAVEEARGRVARAIGADPSEVIFTSGGTEANNMALFGVVNSVRDQRRRKVLVSSIEHPSVLEAAKALRRKGWDVHFLPVTPEGRVDLERAEGLIDDRTLLVSVMLANNETGVLQPVKEIAEICRAHGVLVHCDAVQAFGKVEVRVDDLGVDLLSLSGHKVYAPKRVGALYCRKGVKIAPLFYGGHQERGVRPGTENVLGIVGLGVASEAALRDLEAGVGERIGALRDLLEALILERIPFVIVNGSGPRVPNTTNVSFAFVEGEALTLLLSQEGIAVSTGSACSSGSLEPSHVLVAMGLPYELAQGAIRFSLGKDNTREEILRTVEVLQEKVEKLRELSPLYADFCRSGLDWHSYLDRRSGHGAL